LDHPDAAVLELCASYRRFLRSVVEAHGKDVLAAQREFERAKIMMQAAAKSELRK
jgi:hypothetical protein